MPEHLAFELTEEWQGITGGTMAAPDGATIDLKALLDDTDGQNVEGLIVTADEYLIAALDNDFRFKRAALPDGWVDDEGLPDAAALKRLRKAELEQLYTDRAGLQPPDGATVPKLLHLLAPADFEDPDPSPQPGPTDLGPQGQPVAAEDDSTDGDDGQEG